MRLTIYSYADLFAPFLNIRVTLSFQSCGVVPSPVDLLEISLRLVVQLFHQHFQTSPPQSNLGTARHSRTTMQQSPHWL